MKRFFAYPFIYLFGLSTLYGQVEQQSVSRTEELTNKRAGFNLDEIRVRWKKAALENCAGVPCVITDPGVVTPPTPASACGSISTVLDFDGNVYETVAIGSQCWTKTNLKVTKYNDGTLIPDLTSSTSNPWAPTSGARTEYVAGGVAGYVGTFGYLYNWYAVTDSRKLCPVGWHVPTDSDWNKLVKTIDPGADTSSTSFTPSSTAGTKMKSTVTNSNPGTGLGWDPASPPSQGTNTSGFSSLPGGYRDDNGSFNSIRLTSFFWSTTGNVTNVSQAWYRHLDNVNANAGRDTYLKVVGMSVRCLKD
jgi:uncharacterized protein (TIGR02145 family)